MNRVCLVAFGVAVLLWACGCGAARNVSQVTVQVWAPTGEPGVFRTAETIRVHCTGGVAVVRRKINYPDHSVLYEGRAEKEAADELFAELERLDVWRLADSSSPEDGRPVIVEIAGEDRKHRFIFNKGGEDSGPHGRIAALCRDFAKAHVLQTTEFPASPGRSASP